MLIRLSAIAVGVALIGSPPFLLYGMTVPVERFRTGSYVDFLPFAGALLAIYGGVLLGVAVHWARGGRSFHRLRSVELFKAGVWGAFAVGVVFLARAGIRGLTTEGSFEKGIGNLWGLILIFAALFGTLVSGGVAFLFHGLRLSAGTGGPNGRDPERRS